MILADTTIWIDHLNHGDPELQRQLDSDGIVMHAFVAGELALGPLPARLKTIFYLDGLPQIYSATSSEVRQLIENRKLHNRGIGWTDAHLLAAVLINPSTQLWTRDKALRTIAESLALHVAWR